MSPLMWFTFGALEFQSVGEGGEVDESWRRPFSPEDGFLLCVSFVRGSSVRRHPQNTPDTLLLDRDPQTLTFLIPHFRHGTYPSYSGGRAPRLGPFSHRLRQILICINIKLKGDKKKVFRKPSLFWGWLRLWNHVPGISHLLGRGGDKINGNLSTLRR